MESFIKIGPSFWAVEMTYTDRQTHRHTDTLGSIATYSVKLTEYKNGTVFYFNVLKFEDNRSKIATVRMPDSKVAIMAAMTSSNLNSQNRRKKSIEQMYSR